MLNFVLPLLILSLIINQIHIILQTIYVNINHAKLKLNHNISHTIIAILKSHHHNALHHDNKICKKKNINIIITHINQFNIAISDKFIQVSILNKYNIKTEINNNIISIISCSSFNIIIYNNHIIIKVINIADNHIHKFSIQYGKIFINSKFNNV